MIAKGTFTDFSWKQALLATLLMSTAVSANYLNSRAPADGGLVQRLPSQYDQNVDKRHVVDKIVSYVSRQTGADTAAPAPAPLAVDSVKAAASNTTARPRAAAAANGTAASPRAAPAANPRSAANGTATPAVAAAVAAAAAPPAAPANGTAPAIAAVAAATNGSTTASTGGSSNNATLNARTGGKKTKGTEKRGGKEMKSRSVMANFRW